MAGSGRFGGTAPTEAKAKAKAKAKAREGKGKGKGKGKKAKDLTRRTQRKAEGTEVAKAYEIGFWWPLRLNVNGALPRVALLLLWGNVELAVGLDVAVGHAGSVEGGGGTAFAIEED